MRMARSRPRRPMRRCLSRSRAAGAGPTGRRPSRPTPRVGLVHAEAPRAAGSVSLPVTIRKGTCT